MPAPSDIWVLVLVFFSAIPILETTRILQNTLHISNDDSPIYIWPLPKQFEHGNSTLSVDPNLSLHIKGLGANSDILREAFERYKGIIFGYRANGRKGSDGIRVSDEGEVYDVTGLNLVIASGDETLQFGVDESYILYVGGEDEESIVGGVNIEANTVYGALRGMETFSQLCRFNFMEKNIEIHKAPWYIIDEPKFPFRGLLLDTSRHFLPVKVIKQVIDSMSYAKLNVLHWHIVDEESFPIEVPSYPHLWRGSYTKWEKFTVEDAYEIV
ncbi:Beta-hexosaminidase, family GH20, partial [Zostera marina]